MAQAFVLINCDRGSKVDVIDKLKNIENVKEIQGTFGEYDIIAKVEADPEARLRETISWNMKKINTIRSTLTLMEIEG
jgi:uncharacterized protein with GYD domain